MCGIAGIINSKHCKQNLELVKKMLSIISYRGPDESGILLSPKATMGNVRLSIVDLEGGQQPMCDNSKRFWIVYNGEIFNYIELKADLESKGFLFKSNCDTEVLVQLFAIYGSQCLQMLNGQFAFAIWDSLKEELFMARDRVGIRPLYFNYQNNQLVFGSEIKCILQNPEIKKEISTEGLNQVFKYWTTISPSTVFKGINELQPGHFLTWSSTGINIKRYWQLSFTQTFKGLNTSDYLERFNELFHDAVNIRLRADVEVAAYLSGGIDSSATVAYINGINSEILNTFSITFNEKDFDESGYQNDAVKYFSTKHKSISCNSDDIAKNFNKVIWHSETPMIRTAPVPMMLLSNLVRENGIKVVITGEGADEMLAGYNIFKESEIRHFWSKYPDSKIRPLLLSKLYPYLPQMNNAKANVLKMFFGFNLENTENPFYSHLLRWNNSRHIKKYFTEQYTLDQEINTFEEIEKTLPEGFLNWDSLSKAQWIESTIFMSGYLLSSQGDRMCMANSVEGRYPFLDYRLIEFLANIPPSLKLKGLQEKYLLKKLLKNKIPPSILQRSKQAYRAPIQSAFFADNLPENIKYMLSDEYLKSTGIFNSKMVDQLRDKVQASKQASETENMAIVAIVSTQLLYNQFIQDTNNHVNNSGLSKLKIIEL